MSDHRNDNFGSKKENEFDKKRKCMKTANLVLLIVGCVVLVFAIVFSSIFVGCYGFRNSEDDTVENGTVKNEGFLYLDGLYFSQSSSGSCMVVGVDDGYSDEIEIPSTYLDMRVTAIGDFAFENSSVKSVIIPSSVSEIGYCAFRNCSLLESVYIPKETLYIGSNAFYGCFNLLIFTGASSIQDGWSSEWNPEGCIVYWNFSGMPINNVTFTFVTNGGSGVESISARWLSELPTTTREGYAFYGWYTDQNFSSDSMVSAPYYSADDITLYARWIDVSTQSEGLRVEDDVVTGIGTCTDSMLVLYMPVSDGAFAGNNQITDVYLMDVPYVGDSAFRQCLSLISITIGESTTSIGNYAFYGCTEISKIAFNATDMDGLASGNYVFYNAGQEGSGITVIVGANVTKIPAYIFCPDASSSSSEYAPKVTSLVFEEGSRCESIGVYAFYGCETMRDITIVESMTAIGRYAFYGCNSLTKINYKATSMDDFSSGNYVFYNAGRSGSGTTVFISSNVTKIPAYIFCPYSSSSDLSNEPMITTVVFEDGSQCEGIGNSAFRDCTALNSITIVESVTSIGNNAFYNCYKMTELRYNAANADDLSERNSVFYNTGKNGPGITVTIGASVTKIPAYLFDPYSSSYAAKIATVNFEEGSKCESIGEYAFANCTSLMDITIAESVRTIGDHAFQNCTALTEINYDATNVEDFSESNCVFYSAGQSGSGIIVNVGSNVTRIPAFLFNSRSNSSYAPNITKVIFEDKSQCENIGDYAFAYCSSLTSINIPNSVTAIGDYAFVYCTSMTSIEIPDSVTSIGEYCFSDCLQLGSVTIGENVASIGYGAFVDCSSLITVYYMGTAEEWDEILIDNLNYNLTNVSRYYYSEASNTDGSHWHYVNGKPVIW